MKEKINTLISKSAIEKRLDEIAEIINNEYKNEEIYLICILKGGVFFMVDLAKRLNLPTKLNFMRVSSYGNNTESSKTIDIIMDIDESIEGKNVILIEDIIDSGRTLSHIIDLLKKRNPKTLKLCTLLDKPSRRVSNINVDYIGFTIPDSFVVGYGLDYAQKYRNLNYIGIISFEEK